ncbi:MAG: DUF4299 family protein [Solobacterium sp.]|nr:DUF4299 family protein [Solobacterium sp.]
MAGNDAIRIQITQRSVFAKRLPLEVILGDHLLYGCFSGQRLKRGVRDPRYFVAYDPERIGRGIRVLWNEQEYRDVILELPLPCAQEEIEDLFAMTERIRRMWTGAVEINKKPVAVNHLDNVKTNLITVNLRLLHTVMRGILNDGGWVSLSCAMHRLIVGPVEADEMWAGIYTDKYRDWLHSRQNRPVYIPVPKLYLEQETDRQIGFVTLPSEVSVVWTDSMEGLLRFTEQSAAEVDEWKCALYDTAEKRMIGTVDYNEVLNRIPKRDKEYFDCGRTLIRPLERNELHALAAAGRKES